MTRRWGGWIYWSGHACCHSIVHSGNLRLGELFAMGMRISREYALSPKLSEHRRKSFCFDLESAFHSQPGNLPSCFIQHINHMTERQKRIFALLQMGKNHRISAPEDSRIKNYTCLADRAEGEANPAVNSPRCLRARRREHNRKLSKSSPSRDYISHLASF